MPLSGRPCEWLCETVPELPQGGGRTCVLVLVQQAGAAGEEVAGGDALAAGGEATPLRGVAEARGWLEPGARASP